MPYSLDDFCRDSRETLEAGNDHAGRDKVRQHLEKLLANEDFCSTYLKPDDNSGIQQIYEDEGLGFCVLTYNMENGRAAPPHDHGSSWAIYGQVTEYTDVAEWRRLSADGDDMSLEETERYRLLPGKAGLYDVGVIHSIAHPDGAKYVRVTGTDMTREARVVYNLEDNTAKTIKHVGTRQRLSPNVARQRA